MAYPSKLLRITFGGGLYGKEIWSNSLHVGGNVVVPTDAALAETAAGSVSGVIQGWFKGSAANIDGNATLEWVKVAVIGPDGKYIGNATTVEVRGATGGFSSGYTSPAAPQNTLAITLTTDQRRGLAKMGRIYPPMNAHVTGANGTDSTSAQQATAAAKMISDLNDAFALNATYGTALKVVVASNVREGKILPVTGVKVGDVIDTQRSRRNAMRENYALATVAVQAL